MKLIKIIVMMIIAALSFETFAFEKIPNASAKHLKVTKGKEIRTGIVFINGQYIPAPYKVDRWGTGIRINGNFVSGQVVPWNEFVKTQAGAKANKSEVGGGASEDSAEEEDSGDDFGSDDLFGDDDDFGSLDDLFDDEPKAKKSSAAPAKKVAKKKAKKPTVKITYTFDGEFVPNEKTKSMVATINSRRADIDLKLRRGSMIFFGDKYTNVVVDKGAALKLLEKLPELQQRSSSAEELIQGIRATRMEYLSQDICRDLFSHKSDYYQLKQLREKLQVNASLGL